MRENILEFEKISSSDIKCVWSVRKEMSVQNYKSRPLIDTNCIKAHYLNMPSTVSEIDILKTLTQTNPNSALAKHRYTIKLNLVVLCNFLKYIF